MVPPPPHLVACPSCACHSKSHETECAHCGATLRRLDGTLPRTAAALLLGLSTVGAPMATESACGSDTESNGQGGRGGTAAQESVAYSSATHYGVAMTVTTDVASSTSGMGGAGGGGGAAGQGGSPSDAGPD